MSSMVWKSPPEFDEDNAERLRPGIGFDGEKARPHVAAGHIGLHDDRIAIGRKDTAAEFQRLVGGFAARIRPDADLGAEPVRLHEPASRRHRRLDEPCPVAGETSCGNRQVERRQHRAGAELVLAERKQGIVGADGLQAVQPGERRRCAAAKIGDAVGQRPHQRGLRDPGRQAFAARRRAERAGNRARAPRRPFRWQEIPAQGRSTARDRTKSPAHAVRQNLRLRA